MASISKYNRNLQK